MDYGQQGGRRHPPQAGTLTSLKASSEGHSGQNATLTEQLLIIRLRAGIIISMPAGRRVSANRLNHLHATGPGLRDRYAPAPAAAR